MYKITHQATAFDFYNNENEGYISMLSRRIDKESKLNFESKNGLEIFKIISPLRTSYSTYYERFN